VKERLISMMREAIANPHNPARLFTTTTEQYEQIRKAKTIEEVNRIVEEHSSHAGLGFHLAAITRKVEIQFEHLEARVKSVEGMVPPDDQADMVPPGDQTDNREITIKLDDETQAKLNRLAGRSHAAPSTLARVMLVDAIDKANWRSKAGIKEGQ